MASRCKTRSLSSITKSRVRQPDLTRGRCHLVRDLSESELLGELIEHSVLAAPRRVENGQLNAPYRVADVERRPQTRQQNMMLCESWTLLR